ncbi:type II toxin-antitoxin system PemK/MazF family toxin [Pseudactinotalea sp. HY158]|uniref:type II toxin-antitoxin system PemK/MazF family toxin n=1 Tax=Pseudactinotalea sp. HY158 TaxID=2654547 RepID=UPI00129C6FF6|nr:type II toxin-antitoxin system PemK/MazF family toxin [Pseudactinotalea sp. HY158]QGH70563.1 hypothetical protein GCE65_14475 [Pseudactinotalea sp. HY158]
MDRGWPNHVLLDGPTGLGRRSWAMTEQMRTLSRDRIVGMSGVASTTCLTRVRGWLADFLELPAP